MDPEVWISEDGNRIPISELSDIVIKQIVTSMTTTFESALRKLDSDNFFDKEIIDKIDSMGPSSIFAQYNRVVAEKFSRVENKIPVIDLDGLEKTLKGIFRRDKDAKD